MRRPFLKNKALISTLFILAVFLMTPHFAHAGWVEELVTGGIGMILEILILPLASAILALGGLLLDMAINFSLHTAYIFSLSPAINLGWTIVRDMCNLFFIFVLIYISLGTIVRGTSFGTKDLLTKVIIAALVINFSLFVTKAVVDVSNVFGLWLYGGIQNTLQANSVEATKRASLSDLISARLGIINWMTGGSNATQNASGASTDLSNPSKSFIAKILRLVIVMIATYIFFYCAVLFISRSVTLLFLMVFSPVGFMGSVLPQLKDYASDWKKELTSAAMFPIAFLLMLYISLQFINSLGVLNEAQLTDETLIGGISVSLYFQYAIILFLLQACLSVAKDNAGKMGKAVDGLASGLGKLAIGVAGGGAAMLGKVAIGGAAARLAGSTALNQRIAGGGVLGAAAGALQGGLKNTADFHFDARAMTGVAGKPGKGYSSMMKDNEKKQKEAFEKLGAKPKDTAAAKAELTQAEQAAYASHSTYGNVYSTTQTKFNEAKKAFEDNKSNPEAQEYLKAMNKAKKDLDSVKSAIEADGEHDVKKKIYEEQKTNLAKVVQTRGLDQDEFAKRVKEIESNTALSPSEQKKQKESLMTEETKQEKIKAMTAAMRQGKAAEDAENGLGMDAAKFVSKQLGDEGFVAKLADDLGGELAKETAKIALAGFTKIAADQYIADNKKIAGALRSSIDSKKQKEKDLSKLIAGLAGEGGDEEKPAAKPADAAAPAKPAGGGGEAH